MTTPSKSLSHGVMIFFLPQEAQKTFFKLLGKGRRSPKKEMVAQKSLQFAKRGSSLVKYFCG
jgi:hypothetical protein